MKTEYSPSYSKFNFNVSNLRPMYSRYGSACDTAVYTLFSKLCKLTSCYFYRGTPCYFKSIILYMVHAPMRHGSPMGDGFADATRHLSRPNLYGKGSRTPRWRNVPGDTCPRSVGYRGSAHVRAYSVRGWRISEHGSEQTLTYVFTSQGLLIHTQSRTVHMPQE